MNKIAIVTPVGLSKGIVESQVAGIRELFSQKYEICEIWCHPDEQFVAGSRTYTKLLDIDLRGCEAVYTRSCLDFLRLFIRIRWSRKRPVLIYDFRGLVFEEHQLRNGPGLKASMLKWIERFAYRNADVVHCVSNRFRDYLHRNWGSDVPVKVYPCCITKVVLKTRVPQRPWKFVYVGGVAEWQNLDRILEYHAKLTVAVPDVELLIYTNEREAMQHMLEKHGVKAVVDSVPHSQIASRMAGCDFGYLFRDNITLNQVASPVKFLEYTSNGVIPIVTEGIGDYSADVRDLNLGVLVSPDGNRLADDVRRMELLLGEVTYRRLFDYSSRFLWQNQTL